MRFPLSMTAGMAGYIARHKMRPRPEWQLNLAEEIWRGFEPLQAGNVSFFVDELDSQDPCTQEFTSWGSCW